MASKKTDKKRDLRNSFDINYALLDTINSGTETILDSLTDLSLAKVYYYTIQPDYTGCMCYYCTLNYQIRKVLMNGGKNCEYLSGGVTASENFEETELFYPFHEEWLDFLKKK